MNRGTHGHTETPQWKNLSVRVFRDSIPLLVLFSAVLLRADEILVTNQTPAFTVDTRLTSDAAATSLLIVQSQSSAFVLDTRLAMEGVTAGLTTATASAAFALDTRLPADSEGSANLVVRVESPAFWLDTQLPSENPLFATLIKAAESDIFPLDTRLPQDNPFYRSLLVTAEYSPFTIDTLSGWQKDPDETLVGASPGGKGRFSPDGLRLAKTDGARVFLWDLQTPRSSFALDGHAAEVVSVDFSPLGDQLLTGSADGTFRWWDASSRAQLGVASPPGSGAVYAAYASDGARIIAGRGANATLYGVPAMQSQQEFTGTQGAITAVTVSPEGLALTGDSFRTAILWDTASGAILHRLTNHTKLITAVALFPGGTNALTASLDGTIRVWDTATGAETLTIPTAGQVGDATLSIDGRIIASCDTGTPGTAHIWNAQTGYLIRVFTDTGLEASQIKTVALSPDQTALATTHVDGRVRLWNTGLTPRPVYPITPLPIGTNALLTLRSHGLYYFEVDAQAARSLVITLEAAPAPAGRSAKNAPRTALSPDAQFANLGAPVTGPGRAKSLQTPPTGADITAFRMTATKGHLPSVFDFDAFAQATVTNLHCELPVATSSSNKIYLLVFAPYLSAGTIQAALHAEYSDFHLSSVNPARGGNSGNVTVCIQGTGITADTTARLIGPSGAVASSQLTLWADSTKAWFTFALAAAPVGSYQLEISKPGVTPMMLENAFQVANAVGPNLQSSLTAPSAVRPGRDYVMTLKYANVGDVDIAAPLFVVSAGDQRPTIYSLAKGILTVTRPIPGGNPSTPKVPQVQILGLNQDGPPGILPPGAACEIPLYFQGDGSVWSMAFNLSVLRADATPIDWAALESRFRPAEIPSDLWAAIWANFKFTIGPTWAGYLRALDTQAHLLALAQQASHNAADLLAAVFSQAVGAPWRRTLAAAVDAQAPAPGLPLQFSRFATDGLEHRFTAGPLGRGWSHTYEYTLTVPAAGTVVIRTPGGGARRFALGADGLWHGSIGDYATLAATPDGGFTLLEKDGTSWQFASVGQLASIQDPNHNRISFAYTGGYLTGLAHSAGGSFVLDYNAQGRLSHLTDQAQQVTTYQYDPAGEHLLRVISTGNVTNSYAYEPVTGAPRDHALKSVAFADGTHQFFGWNPQGRLSEQYRDGGAERLQFTYSSDGSVNVLDARNAATTLRIGPSGQLLQITDPLGRPVVFNYDTNLNLTRLTSPVGETTELAYDTQGSATRIVNPLGHPISLTRAGLDRLGNLRDAKGQSTGFDYDPRGNLAAITYPDTSAETFGYDSTGSVTTWTNRRGQPIQFIRNSNGQITRKTYPDGRAIDCNYNSRGQLTNIVDTSGAPTFRSTTNTLAYDHRGFLTNITYGDGKGFAFEYNDAGRRTRRIGTDSYILNYGYDLAGRLETLTDGANRELVRYTYDSTGRLHHEAKGNGTFTTYTYDLAGQVLALTNYAPGGMVQSFFNYTYDPKGNRLTMTTAAGLTRYDYDPLNQLTNVVYPNFRRVGYAYDPAGNRTVVSDDGTNTVYAANNLNQYTQAGDATFGYDLDGNMTRRTDPTGTTTYEYDPENRLVRVVTPTNGVFQYTYDALGNRTAVTHNGITTRHLHDPTGLVDVAADYDADGALVARYDHALGLVSRTDRSGSPTFFSFDALGSTRELTGEGGTLLNAYDYDAFGAAAVAYESVPNVFRFAGAVGIEEEADHSHRVRSRFYTSDLGRFTTADPARLRSGDVNLLRFCGNNPINRIDPRGLAEFRNATGGPEFRNASRIPDFRPTEPASYTYSGSVWEVVGGTAVGVGISVIAVVAVVTAPEWVPAVVAGSVTATTTVMLNPWVQTLTLVAKSFLNIPEGVEMEFTIGPIGYFVMDHFKDIMELLNEASTEIREYVSELILAVVRAIDPNDKIGPAGIGPNRVVPIQDEMEYMIRFENFATASAPVQELIVLDYLDPALDWTTVRFKELAYGGRIITPAAATQTFAIRDTPPADSPAITGIEAPQMIVNISGTINPQIGRVEWRLSAMDTNTSYFPMDALTGFLPPENGTGRGQGYVRFGVRPKAATPIGAQITNIATIVFDGNGPINTPAVWNTIGDIPSLAVTIAYLPGQITAGTPFRYTVGLTNTSTNQVGNLVLTNKLPANITVLTATATVGTVTLTNGAIIWDLGTLTSAEGGQLTVTALPTHEGTFANSITYSGGSGLAIYTAPTDITVTGGGRPALAIQLIPGTVALEWPTNSAGYRLERATALGAAAAWEKLTNNPAVLDGQFRLTLPATNTGQFYRLAKP